MAEREEQISKQADAARPAGDRKRRPAWKVPRWLQTIVIAWVVIIATLLCLKGQWLFTGILVLFVVLFIKVSNQEPSDQV